MTNIRLAPFPKWAMISAFAFGVVFLTAIFVTALFKPNPTAFQYNIFRIMISLAAAGVGAILPGFLDVRFRQAIRAGGALALFLVVYFGSPAALTPILGEPPLPESNAEPTIQKWFSHLDSGELAESYATTSDRFRKQFTYEQYRETVSRYLGAVGNALGRTRIDARILQSPPGLPPGQYQYNVYETSYKNLIKPLYVEVTVIGEKSEWRIFGFHFAVKNDAGLFVPYEPPLNPADSFLKLK